ncbi:MAG: histidinol-phosphate transaminase [Saprospiraceae bacterium]|nr:histidinol-phosphate transaminase [Pyrinomonadaceae bacterium]
MAFDPEKFARQNIRRLVSYSSARHEFAGDAEIYLDANENAFGSPVKTQLNRYPDPLQMAVKEKIAESKGVDPAQIFIGNGSDEAIDLLFRIFCEPGRDEVIICPPTYGMYKVAADINAVFIEQVSLTTAFQLDVPQILRAITPATKMIFICSPNNPTGNAIDREDILHIAGSFQGVVIVDEAYIDFSSGLSLIDEIGNFQNLAVLQTFSKAWGLAGARVGMAFGDEQLIALFNRVKAPYNVSQLAQDTILAAWNNEAEVKSWIQRIVEQRQLLADALNGLEFVQTVYPSDANFLLVKVVNAEAVYSFLLKEKIVVRDRSNVRLCEDCLRITIGTPEENGRLLLSLKSFGKN